MTKNRLLICVSGSGGGNMGPFGLYNKLQYFLGCKSFRILQFDTIPKDIENNVQKLLKIIDVMKNQYKEIYLMGWSRGGAIVIETAFKSNLEKNVVSGLITLATQTKFTENIKNLRIPIMLIHGVNDNVIDYNYSQYLYDNYRYRKKLILLPDVGHNFYKNSYDFAATISSEITEFFLPYNEHNFNCHSFIY